MPLAVEHEAEKLFPGQHVERLFGVAQRSFAFLHHHDDAIHVRAQSDGIGAAQDRGGVEQDVAVLVTRLHLLHQGFHAHRSEQFGTV